LRRTREPVASRRGDAAARVNRCLRAGPTIYMRLSTEEDDVLRRNAIGVMAAVLLLLPAGCTAPGEEEKPDLVVAASLELSGSAADLGIAHERALRLKVDQVNASGLLRDRRLRLVVADNQTDGAVASGQITRFSEDATVTAIITGACTECLVAAANVVNDKGVPTISLAPTTQVSSPPENRRFVFKIGPNVVDTSRALITELTNTGVKTLGVIAPTDAYGVEGREATVREAGKASIAISGTGTYGPTDDNLGQAARQATTGRPDAVVIWAFPVQSGLAAAALREAGYRGRIYLDAAAAGNLFLAGPSAAADGAAMVFTQTLAMDDVIATTPAKAAQKQWFEDYTSRYGSYHGHASFGADALQLIVDAVNRTGTTDRARLREVLENIQMEGLSGPLRITPANHSGLMPQALTVLVARNGRWRLVG
jgi:branched-chain amino acid transport system substrate-binding protein